MTIDPVAGVPRQPVWGVQATDQPTRSSTTAQHADRDHPRWQVPTLHRRVEVTFHDDLRTLMTRVVDETTGALITEIPSSKVLDTVADLVRTIRAREEA